MGRNLSNREFDGDDKVNVDLMVGAMQKLGISKVGLQRRRKEQHGSGQGNTNNEPLLWEKKEKRGSFPLGQFHKLESAHERAPSTVSRPKFDAGMSYMPCMPTLIVSGSLHAQLGELDYCRM